MNKPVQIFRALLSEAEKDIVPHEWHLSARGALSTLQGLETAFADQLQKLARVDPKLDQYLKQFTAEEIAGHLLYIQEIQQQGVH